MATIQVNESSTLPMSALAQARHIGDLTDKIALITGASSGLGRAIAQAYAAAGAYIVNADLTASMPDIPSLTQSMKNSNLNLTTPTVDLINSLFPSPDPSRPRASYVTCDTTSSTSLAAAVAHTVSLHSRLDIMVNNAGISAELSSTPHSARIHECAEQTYDKNMAVNSKGVWLGMKHAITQMLSQPPHDASTGERGWIINIGSILSFVGVPGASTYAASKGAVIQMTRCAALEYAKDQIHVNCINPGFAETSLLEPMLRRQGVEEVQGYLNGLHPWGRIAKADDVAKVAVFLAGPGASFVTGAPFLVDGGYTAQ